MLVRRELEDAAKQLGDRIRENKATASELYEMGCVLLRKKTFSAAVRNLEGAIEAWDGEETDLAQVHNALGYAFLNLEKLDLAIAQFKLAVELQPGRESGVERQITGRFLATRIVTCFSPLPNALGT